MFVIVLTVLVFVHEFGHYIIARLNKVRVETFSIGFGPEVFGWTDKAGTRWKVSYIPLGGYVKFFGDSDGASRPDAAVKTMSAAEKSVSFHHKKVGQRFAVVAAGPIANFILAIAILAGFFMIYGQPMTPPTVGTVMENSAAAKAGFQSGDKIISIDGTAVDRFLDIQQEVSMNTGETMNVMVLRQGAQLLLHPTPDVIVQKDRFGNETKIGRLGISRPMGKFVKLTPLPALWQATAETGNIVNLTFKFMGQIVMGKRTSEEMGGPLRIAKLSGESADQGLASFIWFIAMLSINLGLVNLFPVPMLDGGHLLYYVFEGVRGRPLSEKVQEYGFRVGLMLVLSLMLLATWNDLNYLKIFDF
jgi:regulator of sigma E protease